MRLCTGFMADGGWSEGFGWRASSRVVCLRRGRGVATDGVVKGVVVHISLVPDVHRSS